MGQHPAHVLAHRSLQTLKATLTPGSTFNMNLNGAIDQNQDTFTFTLTSASKLSSKHHHSSGNKPTPHNNSNNNNNSTNNANNPTTA